MIPHPEEQLSAYLDAALAAAERASLEEHLVTCALCRARLAELREVSTLLAALPELAARRSLLPRRLPAWLVPARLVSGLATAAFALVFIVNGVSALRPLGAAPAGAPAPGALERSREAPLAPAAPVAGAPTPAPVPAAATPGATAADQAASPKAAEQRTLTGRPSPTAALGLTEARPTPVARGPAPAQELGYVDRDQQRDAVPAWAWFVAALAAGTATFGLHRAIARRRS